MKKVGFDLAKVKKFQKAFSKSPSPYVKAAYKQWGVRYLAWTKKRFIANSQGGGEWADLAESTIKQRRAGSRKHKKKSGKGYRKRNPKKVAILRDTNTLLAGLDVGNGGNLFKYINQGVRVGFAGKKHKGSKRATIREVAEFHQNGGKNLPKRQILHKPDKELTTSMVKDLDRAIMKVGKNL